MARKFKITMGSSATDKWWHNTAEVDLDMLSVLFNKGTERDQKDGPCFIPGSLLGGKRQAMAVEYVDMLVYDIDGGQELDGPGGIYERVLRENVTAYGYTTYSHLSTMTEINANKLEAWCKKTKNEFPLQTADKMQEYLHYLKKDHLTNIDFDLEADRKRYFVHDSDGMKYRVYHDPVKKFRLVFPLAHRIVMTELGDSPKQYVAAYKAIYHGVGKALGLKYDGVCEDPCRLYYFPSFAPGNQQQQQFWAFGDGDMLLDHTIFPSASDENDASDPERDAIKKPPRQAADVTAVLDRDGKVVNLAEVARHNPELDIEDLLQATLPAEMIRGARPAGASGFHVECPYEEFHTKPGGTATFAANSDGENPWMIFCMHASCHEAGRNKVDMLAEYVRAGHITAEDIKLRAIDPKNAILELAGALTAASDDEQVGIVIDKTIAGGLGPVFEDGVWALICERLGKKLYVFMPVLRKEIKRRRAAQKARACAAAPAAKSGKLVLQDWETSGSDADVVRDRVRRHLQKQNSEKPRVYSRGIHAVVLTNDTTVQQLLIRPLSGYGMAAEIERVVSFRISSQDGEKVRHVECPLSMAEKLRVGTDLELPVLRDVKRTPFYSADCELVTAPGYHASVGIYYEPASGLVIPDVSTAPEASDLAKAKAHILAPLQGFPFSDTESSGQASLENVIAITLTPFVREMTGPVPMYAIDKPDHGVGGTLLAKVISIITTGAGPSIETVKPNAEEWTKSFHSHALAGTHQILIDNVPMGYTIDDSTLAASATADRLSGRILSKSEIGGGDVRWIVTFTGVNVKFSKENARRAVITRLDAKMSDPCARTDFAIPELEQWVKEHRGELIWAYLVLVQNWIAKGKPGYSGAPLASFVTWSNVVGGILECAGWSKFNTNRQLLQGTDAAGIQEFLQVVLNTFGERWVPCGKKEAGVVHRGAPRHLADLYAGMEDLGYLGVSRKAQDYETLGSRLGTKLSTYMGRVVRLDTKRNSAWVTSYDFMLLKDRTNTGAVYSLERVEGSRKYVAINAREAEATEEAMRDAIREANTAGDLEAVEAAEAAMLQAVMENDADAAEDE